MKKVSSRRRRKTKASSKEIPSSSSSPPDQSRLDDHDREENQKQTTCRVCRKSFDIFDNYRYHDCLSPSSSSSEEEVELEGEENKKQKKKSTCNSCGRSFNGARRFAYHQRYCVPRGKDEEPVIDEPWLDGERFEYIARQYAVAAIEYLNKDSNKQYILVKPGPFQTAHIAYGPLVHFNFKAKTTDCPETQTFFAQLRMHPASHPFDVDCCVTLGSNVPHWSSPATNGCSYCQYAVHHPDPKEEVPKLLKGVDRKEAVWLYGDELHHLTSDSTISDDDEDGFHSPSDSDWQHSSS